MIHYIHESWIFFNPVSRLATFRPISRSATAYAQLNYPKKINTKKLYIIITTVHSQCYQNKWKSVFLRKIQKPLILKIVHTTKNISILPEDLPLPSCNWDLRLQNHNQNLWLQSQNSGGSVASNSELASATKSWHYQYPCLIQDKCCYLNTTQTWITSITKPTRFCWHWVILATCTPIYIQTTIDISANDFSTMNRRH